MGDGDVPATPRRRARGAGRSSTASRPRTRSAVLSSRLERLARPRSSSAWKRPICSKYSSRDATPEAAPGRPAGSEAAGSEAAGARLRLDFSERKEVMRKSDVTSLIKVWSERLSPKLSKGWKGPLSPKSSEGWAGHLSPKLNIDQLSPKFLSIKEKVPLKESSTEPSAPREKDKRSVPNKVSNVSLISTTDAHGTTEPLYHGDKEPSTEPSIPRGKNTKSVHEEASNTSLVPTTDANSNLTVLQGTNDHSYRSDCLEKRVQESAPDLLSMPIIASLLDHPFHLSCPPASVVKFSLHTLQREVCKLTEEVAAKERCIAELREKAKEGEDALDELAARDRCIIQLQAKLTEHEAAHCRVLTLYNNPDADSAASSISTLGAGERPRRSSPVLTLEVSGRHGKAETGHVHNDWKTSERVDANKFDSFDDFRDSLKEELKSKIEFLKIEQDLLRNEARHLRRSSMESIRLASKDLDSSVGKIMNYVREEMELERQQRMNLLQPELEQAWNENSRLHSALKDALSENSRLGARCAECKQGMADVQDPPNKEKDETSAITTASRGTPTQQQFNINAILLASVFTSVVSALATQLLLINELDLSMNHLSELPVYLVLGVLGAAIFKQCCKDFKERDQQRTSNIRPI